MAHKKKSSKPTIIQYKFCLKLFTNLGCHFYHNPICSEYHLNKDLTLVTTDHQINKLKELSTHKINSNTFEFNNTNDMNCNWFEINDT